MKREFLAGITHPEVGPEGVREAGFNSVRMVVPFPFSDSSKQEVSKEFEEWEVGIRKVAASGLTVMGITSNPRDLPSWQGEPGTAGANQLYREVCAFLARRLKGVVRFWQIANELNVPKFRNPVTVGQASDFIREGALGVKESGAPVLVGVNMAEFQYDGWDMYRALHSPEQDLMDYVGFDGYYGTWHEGGPETWLDAIERLHSLDGKPIIVQEWSYSSAGRLMTPEEKATGARPCKFKAWPYAWAGGHTPEVQASCVRKVYEILLSDPRVLGSFWYGWSDLAACYDCGQADCPQESAWGLVGVDGSKKPSYYAHKECLARIPLRDFPG